MRAPDFHSRLAAVKPSLCDPSIRNVPPEPVMRPRGSGTPRTTSSAASNGAGTNRVSTSINIPSVHAVTSYGGRGGDSGDRRTSG